MTPIFTQKNLITEERVGECFRQARTFLKLNIDEVSNKIGIKKEYLIAIENENFDDLPVGLYGKNFIKKYADFLNLNSKEIFKKISYLKNNNQKDFFSKKKLNFKNFLLFPKLARNILFSLIILVCLAYLSFYLVKSRQAPKLIIYTPENNITTKENTLTISGQTDVKAEVNINGQRIIKNGDGFFTTDINLKKGINEIIISAQKKYSQKEIIEKQILVQ